MGPRHPNCRSAIVLPKTRKYMDIKPGGCPDWHQHRQIRRFIGSLDSRGYIADDIAVLVVLNEADPCQSRILTEDLLTPRERINRESAKRVGHFVAEVLTKHGRYASMKKS